MNTLSKSYIIYKRNDKYEVAESSFKHLIEDDEIIIEGISNCQEARLAAGRMNCGLFELVSWDILVNCKNL